MWKKIQSDWPAYTLGVIVLLVIGSWFWKNKKHAIIAITVTDSNWHAPSLYLDPIKDKSEREMVEYGQELITYTSVYLGPNGSIKNISNGMNCQNCHLDAGKKPDGNNFSAVYANYPLFRERSGAVESIYKRVSDCFQRSLNGIAPDSNSREFQAIQAYIKWLGKDVKKGTHPTGSGIKKLKYLDRAADPEKGKRVYLAQCASCHGANGEGQMNPENNGYSYPPLWGKHSYNDGAGLYRLSNFAGFVHSNMPFKQANHDHILSSEEAWDIAAFVNSQPRPSFNTPSDWPHLVAKPVDYPFGPYMDSFSEKQHKYGPYQPIILAREKQ